MRWFDDEKEPSPFSEGARRSASSRDTRRLALERGAPHSGVPSSSPGLSPSNRIEQPLSNGAARGSFGDIADDVRAALAVHS
jgi:hypothetical protein